MAALRNAVIGALRTAGITNIAADTRHHHRDSTRPLDLLGITCLAPGLMETTLPGPCQVTELRVALATTGNLDLDALPIAP
ncbi:MAG TPA: hypothetical protein VF635_03740 [Propionibacteriaceae bacterium]|jgi:hypothetical protein